MTRRRVPPDVARVVEDFVALGKAARRAQYVSERVARSEVAEAARRARALQRLVK